MIVNIEEEKEFKKRIFSIRLLSCFFKQHQILGKEHKKQERYIAVDWKMVQLISAQCTCG